MSESVVKAAGLVGPDGVPLSAAAGDATSAEAKPSVSAAGAPVVGGAEAVQAQSASPSAVTPGAGTPNYMMMPVYGMPWTGQPGAVFPGGYPYATTGQLAPAGPQGGPVQPTPASAPLAASGPISVTPSAEGCGCGAVRPAQMDMPGEQVFVIGRMFYDFAHEARLDFFIHEIAAWRDRLEGRGSDPTFGPERDKAGDLAAPYNPEVLTRFLLNLAPGETVAPLDGGGPLANMPNANALTWTVTIDSVPVYALDPQGVYGSEIFLTYVLTLWFQEVARLPPSAFEELVRGDESSQALTAFPPPGRFTRVSQAGHIVGTTVLLNGMTVPTLRPVWRGTYTWDLYDLLGNEESDWPDGAESFLERLYNEFRNVGVSPQDRALNYSAMNAQQTKQIFAAMVAKEKKMALDAVEVDRSTVCRAESDCWDVTYRFFDPVNVLTHAREVFQYTIDVSDIVPVPVGKLRKWQVA